MIIIDKELAITGSTDTTMVLYHRPCYKRKNQGWIQCLTVVSHFTKDFSRCQSCYQHIDVSKAIFIAKSLLE